MHWKKEKHYLEDQNIMYQYLMQKSRHTKTFDDKTKF